VINISEKTKIASDFEFTFHCKISNRERKETTCQYFNKDNEEYGHQTVLDPFFVDESSRICYF
jgi:hypothetical protein